MIGKGSLVKNFIALSGVSGASVGGWYTYSKIGSNNKKNPDPQISSNKNVGTTTKKDALNIEGEFSPKQNKCFEDAFSKQDFKMEVSADNESNIGSSLYTPSSQQTGGADYGCTIMNLKKVSDKYIFESETIVKNEKLGIVVWTEINDSKLRYQVYFLEKDNTAWNFKAGFITTETTIFKEIKSPDGSIVIKDLKITSTEEKEYYGGWKENPSKNKNLLFNGVFKELKDDNTKLTANYIYKQDKKLHKYENPVNLQGKLKDLFSPFKDKKGEWTSKTTNQSAS